MIVYLSLAVCLVGALVYALSAHVKAAELGRIMFFCGLLAFLLEVQRVVSLLPH